jgi:hypothetical protein
VNKIYTPAHIHFLKGIVKGRSYAEITKLFNRKFGFAISVNAMGALLKRYNMPFNTMPIGSERINALGYVEVKYSEKSGSPKNRWKGKHILIWEKANGPVAEGHAVIFADGNKRNFKPGNLVLVSRKELAVLNHMGMLSSKNEDITKVSVNIARLKVLIAERKRGTLQTRGNKKLVIIDNRGSRIVVARDPKTGRYFPARETKFGLRRLKARLKARKTMEEARDDLISYALKRGWQRV